MNVKNRIVGFVLLLSLLFIGNPSALAVDENEIVKQAGYVYRIQHPDNQINKEQGGALNLKMTTGQKQTVVVEIENVGEKEIILDLSLNGARTNPKGGIEHGPSGFKKDKSMKFDLPDLVKMPKKLVIPPKSKKNLDLKIEMPEVSYDGIVTGGVQIIEREKEEKAGKGMTIENRIAYLFGITLRMTDKKIEPELKLNKAYPGLSNYRNVIYLDVSNSRPMQLNDVVIDAEITKKNQKDVLYQSKKSQMEMAPNTLMNYPVSLNGERMEAGKYTAHVTGHAGGEEYKWEKDFTITNEQADHFNQKDVTLEPEPGIDWKKVALIVVAVLLFILVIYLIVRSFKNKNKKVETKRSKNRKRK